MTKFFVGLDLGQSNDYTAMCVLERLLKPAAPVLDPDPLVLGDPEPAQKTSWVWRGGRSVAVPAAVHTPAPADSPARSQEAHYHVRHLERVRNVPYPEIVQKVFDMLRGPPLARDVVLVVDQTGVGAPVVDLFRQARLNPVGVLIHGGDSVNHEGSSWKVPKRNLAATLQVLFQSGRLKISSKLPLASVLQAELLNFKVKIDPVTAHDSYSAWREADHDDLVLATALAAWKGEMEPPPVGPLTFGGATKKPINSSSGGSNWVTKASNDMVKSHRLSR